LKAYTSAHTQIPLHGWDVATIGYGTTRYPDGRKVQRGDKITVIDANQLLDVEVERIAAKLRSSVPHWSTMSGNKQCALISFAYNLGAGFYGSAGFETISKCLRERNWDDVPAAMELYRNPGTNVEAGLLRRRRAEGRLWSGEQQQGPAKLSPDSAFASRITPHVQLGEFALWQEARRFDHQYQVDTAAELAAFLERARVKFGGKPVVISSGYDRVPSMQQSVDPVAVNTYTMHPALALLTSGFVASTSTTCKIGVMLVGRIHWVTVRLKDFAPWHTSRAPKGTMGLLTPLRGSLH
jgi:GH24 family phage-related lysozyme (muramidase)